MAIPDFVGKGESGMEKILKEPPSASAGYAPQVKRHVKVKMKLRTGETASFSVVGTWDRIFRLIHQKACKYDPFNVAIADDEYVEICTCGPNEGCPHCTTVVAEGA